MIYKFFNVEKKNVLVSDSFTTSYITDYISFRIYPGDSSTSFENIDESSMYTLEFHDVINDYWVELEEKVICLHNKDNKISFLSAWDDKEKDMVLWGVEKVEIESESYSGALLYLIASK